ncbi:rhomboid family protein [Sulfolobus acidocaldarius SUSAZ]|nr:rhomboid family protein [Sulfolobus acidocaldarius SUSAZ]
MVLITIGFIVGLILEFVNPFLLFLLIQYNRLVIDYHFYWQLLTSIFVTPSILDWLFNTAALYFMYWLYKSRSAKLEVPIFLVSGIIGNLVYLLFDPNGPPSAGASGGIFGLLSFYALNDYLEKREKNGLLLLLLIFLLSNLFPFLNVNVYAHIGGVIAGLLLSLILYKTFRRDYYM